MREGRVEKEVDAKREHVAPRGCVFSSDCLAVIYQPKTKKKEKQNLGFNFLVLIDFLIFLV